MYSKMVVLERTRRYRVTSYGNRAAFLITRTSDDHGVFLEGDDALAFDCDYDLMDANARDHTDRQAKLDMLCAEYDHVMVPNCLG
jgi:hypothetical protein